jgi:hypothetical protein
MAIQPPPDNPSALLWDFHGDYLKEIAAEIMGDASNASDTAVADALVDEGSHGSGAFAKMCLHMTLSEKGACLQLIASKLCRVFAYLEKFHARTRSEQAETPQRIFSLKRRAEEILTEVGVEGAILVAANSNAGAANAAGAALT